MSRPESSTPQAAEYPGLEAIAKRIFDIPFVALSHGLQELIRDSAMRDAAPDMLEALKAVIDAIPTNADTCCVCQSDLSRHDEGCVIPIVQDAIAKAEGREL